MNNYWNEIKRLARDLRKNQTPEEKIIWNQVRNRRLNGIKFYRQHPILYDEGNQTHFFIVDFYSKEASLVLEIDGEIHKKQIAYDQSRDEILRSKGLRVIRVRNKDVQDSLCTVLNRIEQFTNSPLPLSILREG